MDYLLSSLAVIIALLAVYLYLRIKIKYYLINKKIKAQLKRGIKKEEEARKVLTQKKYKIISHNQKFSYFLKQDNSKIKITIETDYLVFKNGKKYIVEVKSGNESPKITNRNTRRQIIEYYSFIKNDGVLLLNMEDKTISEIEFPKIITSRGFNLLILTSGLLLLIIAILVIYIFSL